MYMHGMQCTVCSMRYKFYGVIFVMYCSLQQYCLHRQSTHCATMQCTASTFYILLPRHISESPPVISSSIPHYHCLCFDPFSSLFPFFSTSLYLVAVIGVFSAIIDNVPLVAATMGKYEFVSVCI